MPTLEDASVVDLFCGAGGLSFGLGNSGLHIAAGLDNDAACKYPFEQNTGGKFLLRDVANVRGTDLSKLFAGSGRRVLVACSPCQPFSGLTKRYGGKDDRWELLLHVQRLVLDVRPEVFSLENVSRLAKLPIWKKFVSGLQRAGYFVSWEVKDVSLYGVPQKRSRLVMLASLLGPIQIPNATAVAAPTVRSAIGHLTPINAGDKSAPDLLHRSRSLTEGNLVRIRASRPAGTWKEWPEEMRAACHVRPSGKTYPSVYGRMSWDAPSPTITTQFYGFGNGRFGHPEQDRALSLREGALLQSFPEDFDFVPEGKKVSFKEIGRLIGNAVPPRLGEVLGQAIVKHLAGG